MAPDALSPLIQWKRPRRKVPTTRSILADAAISAAGTFMLLAPSTSSLPELLLKPGRWTLGSAATCNYQVAAEGVRPRHALLVCGGHAVILKAWDPHTWHNGQPVLGEVRLQPGDCVTIGSVDFHVETTAFANVIALRPDQSRATATFLEPAKTANTNAEGWELERLREQIQELRDELSRRVIRRPEAVTSSDTQNASDAQSLSARINELEHAVAEAHKLNEQIQTELSAARAEQTQREAEFSDVTKSLKSALDSTQQEVASLQEELQLRQVDAAQREQNWEHQFSEWTAERDRLQQELISLETARQQSAIDWEQQQSALQMEISRGLAEAQRLQTQLQEQACAWDVERTQLLEESQRHDEAAHQAQRAIAELQKELAAQTKQLLTERQQVEADKLQLDSDREHIDSARQQLASERQQFLSEQDEHDKKLAELTEERARVEQNATDVLSKFEDLTHRLTDFETQQANLTREQQALEHSWNWLHSDRRKLAEEKDQWQQQHSEWEAAREQLEADRAQLELQRAELAEARNGIHEKDAAATELATELERVQAERQQLQADKEQWDRERQVAEAEWQANVDELQNARTELHSQEQALGEEQTRLSALRSELEAHATEIDRERQVLAIEREAMSRERLEWEEGRTSRPSTFAKASDESDEWSSEQLGATEELTFERFTDSEPSDSLADAWDVGVDLTASREPQVDLSSNDSEIDSDWSVPAAAPSLDEVASTVGSTPLPESAPSWDDSLTSTNQADAVAPTQTLTERNDVWETSNAPETSTTSGEPGDPAVAVLREQLADLFHLPDLRPKSSQQTDADSSIVPTSDGDDASSAEPSDTVIGSSAESEPDQTTDQSITDQIPEPPAETEKEEIQPRGPAVSILESMAFTEEENVDDSVSRYMQHLLARSQAGTANREDKYIPATSVKDSIANAEFTKTIPVETAANGSSNGPDSQQQNLAIDNSAKPSHAPLTSTVPPARLQPVHKQDKDAIRAATEQMRQVANHQTLKNVEASNWNRIKRSIKTKSSLAAFSFVLSAGMFFLGYKYNPGFLVLGVCTTGLGLMTWVDLFIAIREARARTAQLAAPKKKTESEQP